MSRLAALSRAWILLAMLAVLAYAACATGAAPCSILRPVGLGASLIAALLLVVDPPAPSEDREAPDHEYTERR
jgi:hypothetical protein